MPMPSPFKEMLVTLGVLDKTVLVSLLPSLQGWNKHSCGIHPWPLQVSTPNSLPVAQLSILIFSPYTLPPVGHPYFAGSQISNPVY